MTTTSPDFAATFSSHAVNLVNCGIVVLDAGGHIVLWNRWMVTRSGRSAARVRDALLLDVFPELRGSRVDGAVLAAIAEGISTNVPQSQSRAPFPLRQAGSLDGERIDQAMSVMPFNDGKARLCMIEIRDVSSTAGRERQLLEHAEALRARSYVDGLTGISNRRGFDVALERELRRALRHGGELALLLMDIDSFKAYNDRFGHQQGDTCLAAVAQALAGMLKRPADVAARYGGEEFAAILPDTSPQQARGHANAIRAHVLALALPHAPAAGRQHVTLSIGVASFDPNGLRDAPALIAAADQALYAAKRAGRDRVVVHGDTASALD